MGNYFKNLIGFKFQVLCFILLLLPIAVSAQSLDLLTPKTSYNIGDSFFVSLSINTAGNSINTISGKVVIPIDKFSISEVRSGNSIITLWVEKPQINYLNGEISFSGGLPGGYNGSNGPILSIGLKAKKTGSVTIKLSDFIVLLNDGLGTQLQNLLPDLLNLNISSTPIPKSSTKVEETSKVLELPIDSVSPEYFVPMVSRHPIIANNKYFVSFNAVDKDSGISRYEIREELWLLSKFSKFFISDWKEGSTPFVLKFQSWRSKIIVRAHDSSGNYTDGFAIKPFNSAMSWIFVIFAIAVTAFLSRRKKSPPIRVLAKRLKIRTKK